MITTYAPRVAPALLAAAVLAAVYVGLAILNAHANAVSDARIVYCAEGYGSIVRFSDPTLGIEMNGNGSRRFPLQVFDHCPFAASTRIVDSATDWQRS